MVIARETRASIWVCIVSSVIVCLVSAGAAADSVPSPPAAQNLVVLVGSESLLDISQPPKQRLAYGFGLRSSCSRSAGGAAAAPKEVGDWKGTLAYAASAAGLAAGFGQSLWSGGSKRTDRFALTANRKNYARQDEPAPIPEPSALILAMLAVAGAVGCLRRR